MKKLQNLFNQYTDRTPGCAIAVMRNGILACAENYGLADLDSKRKITSKTSFRLASLSKPFTAMAILILSETNKMSLNDTLSKFFDTAPLFWAKITIRQLLSHTSGIPDHEETLYKIIRKGDEPTIRESLTVLKSISEPLFRAGTRYEYSNSAYVLLALIIEKVSGITYREFLKKNIFNPLGMSNSYVLDETKQKIPNRAYGYRKIDSEYSLFDYDPLNYIVGDEGVYSSTLDLCTWSRAWTTSVLLSNNLLNEVFQLQRLSNGGFSECGFGWFIENCGSKKIIFHEGYWVGFNTVMLMDSETNTTVVMLSNTTDFEGDGNKVAVAKQILNSYGR